jgi:dCMP deaminase
MERPSWDEYFIKIAELTSQRSNCIKRRVGCILVKDKRILSLGYNGTPIGTTNCYQGGCKRCCDQFSKKNIDSSAQNLDLCLCLHAEENAILFNNKLDLIGATMYVTLIPCISCVKKILQCQISRVVYINNYQETLDQQSISILTNSGVVVEKWQCKSI